MEVRDPRTVDVMDPLWMESIKSLGIVCIDGKRMIAVQTKNDDEYAFLPDSEVKKALLEEIEQELANVGVRTEQR